MVTLSSVTCAHTGGIREQLSIQVLEMALIYAQT
jgi:hypothetical protein